MSSRSVYSYHESAGPLRKIRRRLYWLDRRWGKIVVEKGSLEPEMLAGRFLTAIAVIGHKYTQVLVGHKQ